MKKRIFALTAMLLLAFTLATPAFALDDDEFSGLAADSLTVTVGYFGGPYYEKAVFPTADLWAMNVQYLDYTFIDNMPSVVIDHVAGITIADVLDAAGIDLGSVQSFNFWTNDKAGGYYTSITKSFLIDTPRYCFYSLPDNFNYDGGMGNEYATADAERVPAMLALADDWQRSLAGASFGSDYSNLNTNTRFRLVFGQTDAVTHTASNSAKWIHKLEITLGGTPTVTLDASVLDLEVGSLFRSEAHIMAADPVIAENLTVEWSSSDEGIATVDTDGNITVHEEGSATISARVGDSVSTILVNGTLGIAEEPESDGTRGSPIGEPGGSQGGTPEASGDGTGDSAGGATQNGADSSGAITAQNENSKPVKQDAPPDAPNTAPSEVISELSPNMIIGREISILSPPAARSAGTAGGVQNWRQGEMADTAIALPIVASENPMLGKALTAAVMLFLLGGAFELLRYGKQLQEEGV